MENRRNDPNIPKAELDPIKNAFGLVRGLDVDINAHGGRVVHNNPKAFHRLAGRIGFGEPDWRQAVLDVLLVNARMF